MADLTIRGIVELILKQVGLREGQTEMKALEREAKRLGVTLRSDTSKATDALRDRAKALGLELNKTSGSAAAVGGALRRYLGIAAITAFGRAAVSEFAGVDRAFNAVRVTMRNLGLETDETIPRVRKHLERIAADGGPPLRETVKIFQSFIGVTKDADATLAAVDLATDISETGEAGLDAATAAEHLANILQGRAGPAARALGIDIKKANGETKDAAELLEEVRKKFQGVAAETDDTQNSLDKLSDSWNRLKRAVGSIISPLVQVAAFLAEKLVAAIETGRAVFGIFFDDIGKKAKAFAELFTRVFDWKTLLAAGPEAFLKGVGKAYMEIANVGKEAFDKRLKEIVSLWGKGGEDSAKAYASGWDRMFGEAFTGFDRLKAQAARQDAEEERKAGEKAAKARLDAQADVLEAEAEAYREGTDKRLELELQALRVRADAEKAQAKISGEEAETSASDIAAAVSAIEDRYRAEKAAKEAAFNRLRANESIKAELALLKAQIDTHKEGTEERLNAEIEFLRATGAQAVAEVEGTEETKQMIRQAFLDAERALRDQFYKETKNREVENEKAVAEAAAQVTQDAYDAEAEAARAQLEQQLADRTLTIDQRAALEQKAIDENLTRELDNILAKEKEELESIKRVLEARIEAEPNPEEQAKLRQALTKLTERISDTARRKEKTAKQKAANEEEALDRKVAESKIQNALDTAQATVSSLEMAFGENKATAAATAAINTYQAITQALTLPFPFNFAVAAAVAAQGFAQVRSILSTDRKKTSGQAGALSAPAAGGGKKTGAGAPTGGDGAERPRAAAGGDQGGGGAFQVGTTDRGGRRAGGGGSLRAVREGSLDDPVNDMVARGLGRSTAQDLIRFFGGGFAEESLRIIQRQQQGGAVSNVTNDNRTVDSSSTIDQRTIIEGNVYGGDAGLRHLKRKLDEAGRKDLGRVQR